MTTRIHTWTDHHDDGRTTETVLEPVVDGRALPWSEIAARDGRSILFFENGQPLTGAWLDLGGAPQEMRTGGSRRPRALGLRPDRRGRDPRPVRTLA